MSTGVRCYIRYNNRGGAYRICSDMDNEKNKKKPPSDIIPPEERISASEFAKKHGGYSNLTNEQHKTYHRIYMREIRKDGGGSSEIAQKLGEALKLSRRLNKEQEKLTKLKQKQQRIESRKKLMKYRERVKKLGKAMRTEANKKKIAEELGINAEDFKLINKTAVNNQEDIDQLEGVVQENLEALNNLVKDTPGVSLKQEKKKVELFFD